MSKKVTTNSFYLGLPNSVWKQHSRMYVCVASQHKQLEACTGHLLNLRELAGAGAPWQKIPPEDAKLQQLANQEFTVAKKLATKDGKLLGCQEETQAANFIDFILLVVKKKGGVQVK
jgi:hypothetical protein